MSSAFGPSNDTGTRPAIGVGSSTGQVGGAGPGNTAEQSGSAETGGGSQSAPTAEASLLLLSESRAASNSGDYDRAAVLVERALAIDPNEALLWIELAEIRFAAGDTVEAQTLARKALTLAGTDRSIAQRALRIADR